MSDYIRSKSFSHNRLNLTFSFFLPERSPNFVFRIRNIDPIHEHSVKTHINTNKEQILAPSTRLQQFKSRLITELNNSRGTNKQRRLEDLSLFRNMKLNQIFYEYGKGQNVCLQGVEGAGYMQMKERKQCQMSQMKNINLRMQRKCKNGEIQMGSQKKDLKQFQAMKHNKSFMIIRKMNKMKEKIALSKKEKFQQQLYRRRETPIHHSQSLNGKRMYKRKTDQKNKSSSINAIRDILKLRDTITRKGEEDLKKGSLIHSFEAVVKGEAKFDQNFVFKRNNQSFKMSVQEYKGHRKKINLRKKMTEKRVNMKREEEISPWGKCKSAEVQLQF